MNVSGALKLKFLLISDQLLLYLWLGWAGKGQKPLGAWFIMLAFLASDGDGSVPSWALPELVWNAMTEFPCKGCNKSRKREKRFCTSEWKKIESPHKCQLRDLWLTLLGKNSPNAVANLSQSSSLQREQHCYSICSTSIFSFVSVICWDFARVCMGSMIPNMISNYSCSCRAELCSTSPVLVAGRFLTGALLAIKPFLCVTLKRAVFCC